MAGTNDHLPHGEFYVPEQKMGLNAQRLPPPGSDTSYVFTVKDSGERQQFDSGMVRDTTAGKVDMSLVYDGPMLWRWAVHLTKGAIKYARRNWMQAEGQAELDRFRESAARHFAQWMRGDVDEDHAAAVFFNINGAEYVKERMLVNLLKQPAQPVFDPSALQHRP